MLHLPGRSVSSVDDLYGEVNTIHYFAARKMPMSLRAGGRWQLVFQWWPVETSQDTFVVNRMERLCPLDLYQCARESTDSRGRIARPSIT